MLFPGSVFVIQSLSHVLSLWNHGLQHTTLPCPHYLPEFGQTHVHWVKDAIQSSYPPLPPSLLALNLSQNQGVYQWVTKGLEFQLKDQCSQRVVSVDFLQNWLVWSPGCPAPQLETISSSVLSLIYGPTLTSVNGCLENHTFDYMDICCQSDISDF